MRFTPLALVGGALLLLAGCGSSSSSSENGVASKSATEIITAAGRAAEAASSVHVVGQESSASMPITLNLYLEAGKGGHGVISEKGLSFEVIVLSGTTYIKGSPAFYKQIAGRAAAQLFQGKWLKAPSSDKELVQLGSLTDLHKLISATLAGHGALAKGSTLTVNGHKAIGIRDTTKGGTLYVAVSGQPLPVEISKTGSEAGQIRFEEWNKPVSIQAPAGAIDLSQLEAAAG
ncbi:MAG: hypothetical protein ACRDK2_04455 [Solirubrobacteraceae bacterium]